MCKRVTHFSVGRNINLIYYNLRDISISKNNILMNHIYVKEPFVSNSFVSSNV